MQTTILSTAIVGLLLSSPVFAAETAGQASSGQASSAAAAAPATQQAAPAAAAETAIAADTQLREKFKALDKNHDGNIDKKEARADKDLHKSFKQIAKKGKLNEAGYINWQQKNQQPRG